MKKSYTLLFSRFLTLVIGSLALSVTAWSQSVWNVCTGTTHEYSYCGITSNSNNCNLCILNGIQGDASGYTLTRGPYNGAYTTTVNWLKPGTYTLYYSCESTGRVVTVGQGETIFPVTGGVFCNGNGKIRLENSETGQYYTLRKNGMPYGSTQSGSAGTALEWIVTETGTFDVIVPYGCTRSTTNQPALIGSASIITPESYPVEGGGVYCPGTSFDILLPNSQLGVTYELYKDGVFTGLTRDGEDTNRPIGWSEISGIGTYTVKALGPCGARWDMIGQAVVTYSQMAKFDVGGGGSFCPQGAGVSITLSGSQQGISYQLKKDGFPAGVAILGTGNPLTWSNQIATGIYSVDATEDHCTMSMNLTASVSYAPLLEGATMTNAIDIGSGLSCRSYGDQKILASSNCYSADYGTGGDDIYYKFTVPNAVSLTVSHCGTAFNSQLHVLNSSGGVVTSRSIDVADNCQSVTVPLSAGTYYVISKAASIGSEGVISTQISLVMAEQFYLSPASSSVLEDQSVQLAAPASMTSVTEWLPEDRTIEVRSTGSITVRPGQTTSYSAKGVINGCETVATGIVTVQPDNTNRNYIRQTIPLKPEIESWDQIRNLSVDQKSVSTSYFDGLGRGEQEVSWQASPDKRDVVQPIVFDKYGREAIKYLPYVSNSNSGKFKIGAIGTSATYNSSAHHAFYTTGNDAVANDDKPYAVAVYDASPLNEVVKQGMPGSIWQPGTAAAPGKAIKKDYVINKANEVHGFRSDGASNVLGFDYQPGKLYGIVTTDEQGYEMIEYTDFEGRIVCKKVQHGVSGQTKLYADTYYVYNELGDLWLVLPPEAINTQPSPYDQAFIDAWAFQYKYDNQRRMIGKKVPGAGWIYMVYDDRDRLVMTQDANQRTSNQWSFTKYDWLSRPILTGIHTADAALTQSEMQDQVNIYYNNLTTNGGAWYETFVGNVGGDVHGYTNLSYPTVTSAPGTVNVNSYLTATYYDNYDFRTYWFGPYDYLDENLSQEVDGYTYRQFDNEFSSVKGQVTGTKVRVLDNHVSAGSKWLAVVNYYDDQYRLIQTVGDNYQGGFDRTSTLYDFVGSILKTRTTHYGLHFRDMVKVDVTGDKIAKANGTGTGAWDGGTASVEMLPANTDGWIEFTANSENQAIMVGVSESNPGITWESIHYKFYLTNSSNGLRVCLNNSVASVTSATTYQVGDVFRIERKGAGTPSCKLYFYRNGSKLYETTTVENDALVVDVSVHGTSAQVVNLRSNFGASGAKVVEREFGYDHAGRLSNTWHKIDTQQKILLSHNEYNELGQLIDKKLHSTVSDASDAKQSVDYRYNIRGWLTSMNNADLSKDSRNDELGDLFGFDLAYNEVTDLNNSALYNGNISAMKWSNNMGLGETKAEAYVYSYDPLNRITSASYKVKTSAWETNGLNKFSETGYSYDLNGNIKTLTRYDHRGSDEALDILTYGYGTGTAQSNRLLKVSDAGDDYKGFVDGADLDEEYAYDSNGNMIKDANKGITGTDVVTYNYLNLPASVSKGAGAHVLYYIYDATGRKHAQIVSWGNQGKKQTDYAGDFIYEHQMLKFLNHEEGRAVLSTTETIVSYNGETIEGVVAAGTVTLANVTMNGTEKYLKVLGTGTSANAGAWPIGGTIGVQPGERYVVRVKGYRTTSLTPYILIKVNGVAQAFPGTRMPNTVTAENWIEQEVLITGTGTQTLQAGVVWQNSSNGQQFFINEFEVVRIGVQVPEYQYNLKDHLGNVRLTFTTKLEIETTLGTYENANTAHEAENYLRINEARKVYAAIFDRTNDPTDGYAQRLSGGANERYGYARSISVMPGDKVYAEVYAKYVVPSEDPNFNALITEIANHVSGVATSTKVIDGGSVSTSTLSFPFPTQAATNTGSSTGPGPKAYLNWLVFDRDHNWIEAKSGYKRLSNIPQESGTDVEHEKLFSPQIVIDQPGYVYIFLSNEEDQMPIDVYFDDFKVEHEKSPVLATDDYYPFGLAFSSYVRENTTSQNNKYNNKEDQIELELRWLDYGVRMYQPDLGRFFVQDRFSEKYFDLSPYNYAANDPVVNIDINGDSIKTVFYDEHGKKLNSVPENIQKMFNDEFGIKVGYNAKTEMLYYHGDFQSKLSQSQTATGLLKEKLTDDNAGFENGQIVFGYGNHLLARMSVLYGQADKIYGNHITSIIDLDDFNADGSEKNQGYYGISVRDENMARVFEHEYLGHTHLKILARGDGNDTKMGRVVEFTNLFRRERNMLERLNYVSRLGTIYGRTSDFSSKKEMIKYIRDINRGKIVPTSYLQSKRK